MKLGLLRLSKVFGCFCFFDQGDLIVLTNCFIKKSQKTPRKEIKMAEKLKKEYINEKCGGK